MEAVKLLVVREWRRMELHPRFWIGSLVLSLLLSTATPAMLLAHYVVVVTLLGALPLGLDNPATAVETLTLPVTRRQVVTACYLWVGLTSLGLTGAMSLWNLLCRAVLPFSVGNALDLLNVGAVQTGLAAGVLGILVPLHLCLGNRSRTWDLLCYLGAFFAIFHLLGRLAQGGSWRLPPLGCLGIYLAAGLFWYGSYWVSARLYAHWELP